MILHVHGETSIGRVEARPSCDRPALQHVAELQPKVVVELPRRMLLNDEKVTGLPGFGTSRLESAIKAPLFSVPIEHVP